MHPVAVHPTPELFGTMIPSTQRKMQSSGWCAVFVEGPLHCPSPLLGHERLLAEQVAPRIGTTGGLGQDACSQEISAGGLDGAGGQAVQCVDKQYSGVAKCLPRSCTLGTGQVVIVSLSDGSPEPALVMSVFRANKKCASSLCFDENPRGSTVAVRAVLLSKSERREDTLIANSHSQCQIFPLCNVGVQLPVASFSGTLTGYQCQLTKSSQDVLQNLLAETSVTIPKPVKKGRGKHIVSFTVEKLRRNDQGRECIRQEFQRLLRVDAELFAGSKPIVDSGTQLIQTNRAAKETEAVYMQSLVDKVAYYMQDCFVQHRNPVQYGAKVYGELSRCGKELAQGMHHSLVELVDVLPHHRVQAGGAHDVLIKNSGMPQYRPHRSPIQNQPSP